MEIFDAEIRLGQRNGLHDAWDSVEEQAGALEGTHTETRVGVTCALRCSTKTGKRTAQLYALKSGDLKKQGILLNLCPFCGTDLRSAHEPSEEDQ